jgi:hypothetical protein
MNESERTTLLQYLRSEIERVYPEILEEMLAGPWKGCDDYLEFIDDVDFCVPFGEIAELEDVRLEELAGADDEGIRTYVWLELDNAGEHVKWFDVEPLEEHVQCLLGDDPKKPDDNRVMPTLRRLAEHWTVPQYMALWGFSADEWRGLLDDTEPHLNAAEREAPE